MQPDEIETLAKVFFQQGVTKIRLTGGEPLARKDAADIIRCLSVLPVSLTMTTNGTRLHEFWEVLDFAGLRSEYKFGYLTAWRFASITRRDQFGLVKGNIDKAIGKGYHVKVNMVVMKGVNDDEVMDFVHWTTRVPVNVRFIEFMPFEGNGWTSNKVVTTPEILETIEARYAIEPLHGDVNATAKVYRVLAPSGASESRSVGAYRSGSASTVEPGLMGTVESGPTGTFDQSSMDGYALSFQDFQERGTRCPQDELGVSDGPGVSDNLSPQGSLGASGGLIIQGFIPAGRPSGVALQPGQAARIFTGGALPEGADTVVMQEKVRIEEGTLFINDEHLARGINVRPRGAEIKAGDLARCAANGERTEKPGLPLEPGEVYEANPYSLHSGLKQYGFNKLSISHLKDIPHVIEGNLIRALRENDMVLLTGGVSVGDFDYVAQAAANLGIETVFHWVAQKPGKPLFFGRLKEAPREKYIFGLPGNPASTLVAFYEYVLPALCALTGRQTGLQVFKAPLEEPFSKPRGLTQFLKAIYNYNDQSVRVLVAQESYRLSSFAQANCLVQVDAETMHCPAGAPVEVHLLPNP